MVMCCIFLLWFYIFDSSQSIRYRDLMPSQELIQFLSMDNTIFSQLSGILRNGRSSCSRVSGDSMLSVTWIQGLSLGFSAFWFQLRGRKGICFCCLLQLYCCKKRNMAVQHELLVQIRRRDKGEKDMVTRIQSPRTKRLRHKRKRRNRFTWTAIV